MKNAWIPLAAALLDWLSVHQGWKRLGTFTKPGVMLAVLLWMLLDGPGLSSPLAFFFAGIVFSLLGDVLLLPAIDRFLGGLVAFLLAHLAYIAGLNTSPFPFNFSTLMFAAVVILLFARVLGRVRAGLEAKGKTGLLGPTVVYALVLAVMLLSGLAALAKEDWSPTAALRVATGAVLFTLSDIILIWNRFVSPISRARLKTRVPYQLGQIMIVAGAMQFFI